MATAIEELEARLGCPWGNLAASRKRAAEELAGLAALLDEEAPADTSIIVFGSVARGELTAGSDLDWTLLVDGQADHQHAEIIARIRKKLETREYKGPGATALFGGLAFSHELVHRIGGETDTNRNITQRILLLIESRSLGVGEAVRERVLRAILERYLADDIRYHEGRKVRVPRFLLNDVVRYWRTLAVDYATKRRDRAGAGWALRNVKLRLSRKLIFAAALYTCLSCELAPTEGIKSSVTHESAEDLCDAMVEHLIEFTGRSPLETLAQALTEFATPTLAKNILDNYDAFLGILNDTETRLALDKLSIEDAFTHEAFLRAKRLGAEFHAGLVQLFFNSNEHLTRAAQTYGVF